MPCYRALSALALLSALGCTPVYGLRPVAEAEVAAAASKLSPGHPTTTVHDLNGSSYTIDAATTLEVTRGTRGIDEPIITQFGAQRDDCNAHRPGCLLREPIADWRAQVRTGLNPDDKTIGDVVLGTFILGAVGGLVAGNVVCFSGPCDDGAKGALVTGDVVAGGLLITGIVIIAVVAAAMSHMR